MSERDGQNRKCAEWLGFRVTKESDVDYKHQFFTWHPPDCPCTAIDPESLCSCVDLCGDEAPDFFTDETASAMLLEMMPEPGLSHNNQRNSWFCDPDQDAIRPGSVEHADRKTAIADAFLALIESGWRKPCNEKAAGPARCKEDFSKLPTTSGHLWRGDHHGIPGGDCLRCGCPLEEYNSRAHPAQDRLMQKAAGPAERDERPVCPDSPSGGCESYICRPDKQGVWRHAKSRAPMCGEADGHDSDLKAENAQLRERVERAEELLHEAEDYISDEDENEEISICRLCGKVSDPGYVNLVHTQVCLIGKVADYFKESK